MARHRAVSHGTCRVHGPCASSSPDRRAERACSDVSWAVAIDQARRNGARVVEAYPVDPDSPSYRFMGFVPAFEAAGFVEARRAGSRRHVMALRLDSSSTAATTRCRRHE